MGSQIAGEAATKTTKTNKKTKDLPPKSATKVKGGGLLGNDNLTLIRIC